MSRTEKITIVLGALAVIVSIAAWQFPGLILGDPEKSGSEADTSRSESSPRPSGTSVATTAAPPASQPASATFVDALAPLSGAGNVVPAREQPAAVASAGYPHALVIGCPSNHPDDKVREVTYDLRGRYQALTATVRPHYGKDPESVTYVTAFGGFRQKDGTLARREVGKQYFATAAAPQPLTAEVRGAEQLILQVRCETPDGVIVLESARLTRS